MMTHQILNASNRLANGNVEDFQNRLSVVDDGQELKAIVMNSYMANQSLSPSA
jgi:hypothetical protein